MSSYDHKPHAMYAVCGIYLTCANYAHVEKGIAMRDVLKRFQVLGTADIKCIALIVMLIDHIGYLFDIQWCRVVGRLGFPLFVFAFVVGWQHTHDRAKYFIRLCKWAIIAQVPFSIMKGLGEGPDQFSIVPVMPGAIMAVLIIAAWIGYDVFVGKRSFEKHELQGMGVVAAMMLLPVLQFVFYIKHVPIQTFSHKTNAIYTMAIGAIGLYFGHMALDDGLFVIKRMFAAALVVMFTCSYGLYCDYTLIGLLLIWGMGYVARRISMDLFGPACAAVTLAWQFIAVFFLYGMNVSYIVSVLVGCGILCCYNDRKGAPSPVVKRFNYMFYPVHMLALSAICILVRLFS